MATILVGRSPWGQQPQNISDSSVSRKHLEITQIDKNKWRIRDVGSKYGTTVDGLPIVETVVGPDAHLVLGAFETTIRQLLNLDSKRKPVPNPVPDPVPTPAETVSVRHLQAVYEEYMDALKDLQKKKSRANIMRMLPLQLLMPLALGLSGILIDDTQQGSLIKGCIMVGIMGLTSVLSLRMLSVNNQQIDEQFELNRQFQINYVCPKCHNFFGQARPYEALLIQGKCPHCKAQLIG